MKALREKVLETELAKSFAQCEGTDAASASWQAQLALLYAEALDKAQPLINEAEAIRIRDKEAVSDKVEANVARTMVGTCWNGVRPRAVHPQRISYMISWLVYVCFAVTFGRDSDWLQHASTQ